MLDRDWETMGDIWIRSLGIRLITVDDITSKHMKHTIYGRVIWQRLVPERLRRHKCLQIFHGTLRVDQDAGNDEAPLSLGGKASESCGSLHALSGMQVG